MSTLSSSALGIVKQRLGRLDTALDEYLAKIIESSEMELRRKGVDLQDDTDDLMLLTDHSVWRYQCRDKPDGMPKWLALRIRERWLATGGRETT